MSAIPLVSLPPAGAAVSREALQDQLAAVRLPPRSAALLARAGLGLQATGCGQDATTAVTNAAIGAGLARLVELLAAGVTDRRSYRRAVAPLVGLGPGLTPTGDDLLVALLAISRRLAAGRLLSGAAASQLASAMAKIPTEGTTAPAHRLLAGSVVGCFPLPLAQLVEALGDPEVDKGELSGLVERAVATGAHTGADWLAGVVALARVSVKQGDRRWPNASS